MDGTGLIAEQLCAREFGLTPAATHDYDLMDDDEVRYEIKSSQIPKNGESKIALFVNIQAEKHDHLILVLFGVERWYIWRLQEKFYQKICVKAEKQKKLLYNRLTSRFGEPLCRWVEEV